MDVEREQAATPTPESIAERSGPPVTPSNPAMITSSEDEGDETYEYPDTRDNLDDSIMSEIDRLNDSILSGYDGDKEDEGELSVELEGQFAFSSYSSSYLFASSFLMTCTISFLFCHYY